MFLISFRFSPIAETVRIAPFIPEGVGSASAKN